MRTSKSFIIILAIAAIWITFSITQNDPSAQPEHNSEINDWKVANVESSVFQSLGYSKSACAVRAKFVNGEVYEYHDVPYQAYKDWLGSDSKGGYFNRNIKGKYRHTQKNSTRPGVAKKTTLHEELKQYQIPALRNYKPDGSMIPRELEAVSQVQPRE